MAISLIARRKPAKITVRWLSDYSFHGPINPTAWPDWETSCNVPCSSLCYAVCGRYGRSHNNCLYVFRNCPCMDANHLQEAFLRSPPSTLVSLSARFYAPVPLHEAHYKPTTRWVNKPTNTSIQRSKTLLPRNGSLRHDIHSSLAGRLAFVTLWIGACHISFRILANWRLYQICLFWLSWKKTKGFGGQLLS